MVYKNLVSDCWLFRERFHVLDAAKILEICEIAKIVRENYEISCQIVFVIVFVLCRENCILLRVYVASERINLHVWGFIS